MLIVNYYLLIIKGCDILYLHLGEEYVVKKKDIIGIFDIDTTSIAKTTREFLSTIQAKKVIINTTADLPRSFIVCRAKRETIVFISHISTATLKKRARTKIVNYC